MISFFEKRFLGVDIGTSFIKIVELSQKGKKINLENYGEISSFSFYKEEFRRYKKSSLFLSVEDIARGIRAVIEEAGMKAKEAAFSIPDFSTFFINLNLPPMSQEELAEGVKYAARRYIPLSLSEVSLDWMVIEGRPGTQERIKVLLAAVPNDLLYQYQKISQLSRLQLSFLEAEAFSLVRALIPKDSEDVFAILDIGAQSTTINIVDKGKLKRSYSLNIAGNHFTEKISSALSVSYREAEELKEEIGLLPSKEKINSLLYPLLNALIMETKRVFGDFFLSDQKEVKEVIISGASANMPGLKNYLEGELGKKVSIGNPFENIFYPPLLEKELKKIGPSFAVATGLALRGLEQ